LENAVVHLDELDSSPRVASLSLKIFIPRAEIKLRGGYADNPVGFRALLSLCLLFPSFSLPLLFRLAFISSPFAIAFVTETRKKDRSNRCALFICRRLSLAAT